MPLLPRIEREFRLRRGEFGIGADADGLAGADADARRPFEEDLRAVLSVDMGVHAFAGAVFGIAEGRAGFIGAAAAPHFARMNGADGNGWLVAGREASWSASCGSGIAFGFGAADQVREGVSGDGADAKSPSKMAATVAPSFRI